MGAYRHLVRVALLIVGLILAGLPDPTPARADSPRFYHQTGYAIATPAILDYFDRRGGVNTFGYPVSRPFVFAGFTTQVFQRRVVQLDAAGHARLLNLLDPGIMPYPSFNGAIVPGVDSGVLAQAPDPGNTTAVLTFVQSHAPDSFQSLPVNFY